MINHKHEIGVENVLVLQGGGSLGAFACGVFKAFAKKNIKFDIIAGTSIGGINGAIAAGSMNDKPEKDLERFWLDLARSSYNIIPDIFTFDFDYDNYQAKLKRSPAASLNAAFLEFQVFLYQDGLISIVPIQNRHKCRITFSHPGNGPICMTTLS